MSKKNAEPTRVGIPISDSTFRSGDQGEYLTQYLLSNFGVSVLIPRQEDQGFDFHCSLNAAKPRKLPDFRHSFYLQVKVGDPAEVSFGGMTSANIWRSGRIRWLFNLDIPLLLGFVHLGRREIKLFQTSARWLLYCRTVNSPIPCEVVFRPSVSISSPGKRKKRGINPGHGHDGQRWHVDLGPPVTTIKLADLMNEKAKQRHKDKISAYIELERRNSAHRVFNTQWGEWVSNMATRSRPFGTAWVTEEKLFPYSRDRFYPNFGVALSSLIFRLQTPQSRGSLKVASELFRRLETRWKMPASMRDVVEQHLYR